MGKDISKIFFIVLHLRQFLKKSENYSQVGLLVSLFFPFLFHRLVDYSAFNLLARVYSARHCTCKSFSIWLHEVFVLNLG